MRMRVMAGILLGLAGAGSALAQPVPPPDLPPLGLSDPPRNSPGAMPGVIVSHALQAPVEVPPPPLPIIPLPKVVAVPQSQFVELPVVGNTPRFWAAGEVLLWWPKQQTLIPIATGNNAGFFPILGMPGTVTLIGDQSVKAAETTGGRFTLGVSLGGSNNLGIEANYLSLSTQNRCYSTAPYGPDVYAFLGIPLVKPDTNLEDFVPIRAFDQTGDVQAFTSTRVAGWEALVSMDLYEMPKFRIQGLAGYRYFLANEGLLIQSSTDSQTFDPRAGLVLRHSVSTDEVTTSNQFRGGTLGTRAIVNVGSLFFELDSKVSLGNCRQVVQRTGRTDATVDIPGNPETTLSPGGVFVNPTNAGRYVSNVFAVLPETGMRIGYNFGAARLFFGYNVIYLNQSVRPADQLDRTIDLNSTLTGVPSPLGRPSPAIVGTEFWVQGVSFGLELRY